MRQRLAYKARFCIGLPAADGVADQHIGHSAEVEVGVDPFLSRGHAQRLLEGRFDLFQQRVDAGLKALVLIDQRFTDQHAGHAAVLLSKAQQQGDDVFDLLDAINFFRLHLVDD